MQRRKLVSISFLSFCRYLSLRRRVRSFTMKILYRLQLRYFCHFESNYRNRNRYSLFSTFICRLTSSSLVLSLFLKWKHETSSQILSKTLQSLQYSLDQSEHRSRGLLARVSSLERYRHASLLNLGEIRNKFVMVDDIGIEISTICRSVHAQSYELPAPLHALSHQGQLVALESALVSLGTSLSPWVRPRLDLPLVEFVESLNRDLMLLFKNPLIDQDVITLEIEAS